MMLANRIFDKKTGYRFHKVLKKREKKLFKKYSVFRLYAYDKQIRKDVITRMNHQLNGKLKVKSWYYAALSFLYYKLQFRLLFQAKNKLLAKLR